MKRSLFPWVEGGSDVVYTVAGGHYKCTCKYEGKVGRKWNRFEINFYHEVKGKK